MQRIDDHQEVQVSPPVLIPIGTPEAIESTQKVTCPVDAYKTCMNDGLIRGLRKSCHPEMNPFAAIMDSFYHDESICWKKIGILASSFVIGGLSSIFAVKPAGDAANVMVKFIERQSGVVLPFEEVVVLIFQVTNVGELVFISSNATYNMLERYLNRSSKAVTCLTYQKATPFELSKKISRSAFNLISAIATGIPKFLLTWQVSLPLAILTSFTGIPIRWTGMENLKILPTRHYAARKAEAMYLREQLEIFLRLSFETQKQILGELTSMTSDNMDDALYRKFYARLLNLSKPKRIEQDQNTVIQREDKTPILKSAGAQGSAFLGAVSQLTWVETTGAGIAHLFPDPKSPEALVTGVSMALLLILPSFGLGYYGGLGAGETLLSSNEPLASLFHPGTREILKWLFNVLSALSGGTIFTLGYDAVNRFTQLTRISGLLSDMLKMTFASTCYIGSATVNGYYLLKTLDQVLIYFAIRCGNEEIQRLYEFVLQSRKMHQLLLEMSEDNYRDLLGWKMKMIEGERDDLSMLLHGVLSDRLTEAQYQRLQNDLNSDQNIVLDQKFFQQTTTIIDHFYDNYGRNEKRHPDGLRQRCAGLFACYRDKDVGKTVELTPQVDPEAALGNSAP